MLISQETNKKPKILSQMNREPKNINNDYAQYEALKLCQNRYVNENDTCKYSFSFPIWPTVAMQHEDGGLWMHSH